MARKKKDQASVDEVLGDVMDTNEVVPHTEPAQAEPVQDSDVVESPIAMSESSDYDRTVHETAPEPTLEPAQEMQTSNLKITVMPVTSREQSKDLTWKGNPAGELEMLLREKVQQFAVLHFGMNLRLDQVDQAMLDKCASDYRFLREIERLTRKV